MTAAYDALSKPMQEFCLALLRNMISAGVSRKAWQNPVAEGQLAQAVADNPPVTHPVIVRTRKVARK